MKRPSILEDPSPARLFSPVLSCISELGDTPLGFTDGSVEG